MIKLIEILNYNIFWVFLLYLLGAFLLLINIAIILTTSAVHSILYLMFLFLFLTELSILLKMEFLALIFLIIYVGAVCVLMLFHIKLIKTFVHRFDAMYNKKIFFPIFSISLFLPFIQILTLLNQHFNKNLDLLIDFKRNLNSIFTYTHWIELYENTTHLQIFGFLIYNVYFIYLIFGSLILLIAMIGSIFLTLTINHQNSKKLQLIKEQLKTKITIIK